VMEPDRTKDNVIQEMDALHARISCSQRAMFERIAEADRQEAWRESGARDMAHFLSMRYGISLLEGIPLDPRGPCPAALTPRRGCHGFGVGIDKVVELARFATAGTESHLAAWARGVSVACVRRKADVTARQAIEDVRDAQTSRFLSWWYFDDGRRFELEAELPAAERAAVARALEHLAEELPVMPGEENPCHADARRADALVALASTCLAGDSDPDRATVVVHAPLEALVSGEAGCELEGGALIHAEAARRLLCSGRVRAVIENGLGHPIGVGRMAREPSAWMLRQLRYRDSECRFPGCGARRRPTTSSGGSGEAGPTWITCCSCARSTTSSFTSTDGSFPAPRTGPSNGSIPTEPAIAARRHLLNPSDHDQPSQP